MNIHGTKVARAHRQVPLHVCELGPGGAAVFRCWRDIVERRSTDVSDDNPLFANKNEASKRTSDLLSRALDSAFCHCSGEDAGLNVRLRGAYTAYSLRHAAAIRMIQGAIDLDFKGGNFICALEEVAATMGHQHPTLISSYLGTAASILDFDCSPCK
jgi:hypothetical protein